MLAALPLFALVACAATTQEESLSSRMDNPLYAERYYDDLVEQMVNLIISEDPIIEDEDMKSFIDEQRVNGLREAETANERQRDGLVGNIVSDYSYAIGEVLLLDGTLYVGPEFETVPGPDLHMHLSTVLDPRDGTYPDESAVDLGEVANPYGAHSYALPADAPDNLRTVVLYDHDLKRIYGFAQLSARR